jgi:hypothetical protein
VKQRLLLGLLGVGLLFLIVLVFVVVVLQPVERQVMSAQVNVDDYVGINLDNDKLYFGTIPPGDGGKRHVVFTGEKERVVTIRLSGEAGGWIQPETTLVRVDKGEERKVLFVIRVPENASFGNHTAEVYFTSYRPAASWFLE